MRIMTFSEQTVTEAETALGAGFDVVEKYETTAEDGKRAAHVCLANARSRYEIDATHFPELQPGDDISLAYIANHERINRFYADRSIAPNTNTKEEQA